MGCIKKYEICLKNVKFLFVKKYDLKIMIFDNYFVSEGVYKVIEIFVYVKKILCWSYLDNIWMIIINKNKNIF